MEDPGKIQIKVINELFNILNNYPKENGIPINIVEYLEIANLLNQMFTEYHYY